MTSPDIHHVAPPLLLRQQLQSLFLKKPLLQLLLRGSETRFCELQMMMTREEQSNTCCLQEVMWLLFFSYSCRDGDGDGSFCSKVNYRANICSITSPMRPKRGWKDPLHLTNVNRYVMTTIVLKNQLKKVSFYNVYFRNWTLIPQNQITNIISYEIFFLWFSLIL